MTSMDWSCAVHDRVEPATRCSWRGMPGGWRNGLQRRAEPVDAIFFSRVSAEWRRDRIYREGFKRR